MLLFVQGKARSWLQGPYQEQGKAAASAQRQLSAEEEQQEVEEGECNGLVNDHMSVSLHYYAHHPYAGLRYFLIYYTYLEGEQVFQPMQANCPTCCLLGFLGVVVLALLPLWLVFSLCKELGASPPLSSGFLTVMAPPLVCAAALKARHVAVAQTMSRTGPLVEQQVWGGIRGGHKEGGQDKG